MALIFSMWIETEHAAEGKAIELYFHGRKIVANSKVYQTVAYPGGMVTVEGISRMGITSQSDAEDIYQKLGSPGEMVTFCKGFVWTPYKGEKWN